MQHYSAGRKILLGLNMNLELAYVELKQPMIVIFSHGGVEPGCDGKLC